MTEPTIPVPEEEYNAQSIKVLRGLDAVVIGIRAFNVRTDLAANLPALVPDAGGTATLVREGENGFTFHADDAAHLAARLIELKNAPAELLNRIAGEAQNYCATQCSEEASVGKYRELFAPR